MNILKKHWRYLPSIWIAFVFIQSLFFKFSNSPETQYIFGKLGDWSGFAWFADYGAYGVGIAELIASILLFTRFWAWGALLAFEIMVGAIFFHVATPLGIVMPVFENAEIVGNDGGTLFVMACLTCLCAAVLTVYDWTSEHSQLRKIVRRNAA